MPLSWATVAASAAPLPTPQQRWSALLDELARKPLHAVLLEALGVLNTPSDISAPLIEHFVVVGIDTEAWTANTDEMTEIGLVIAENKTGRALNGDVGPFGENILKNMEYHHLRIWENAHLRTTAGWMRGPKGNRFGQTRFTTFSEARAILDAILNQPINSSDPSLAGLKRPVVLVGHALTHDKGNVQKDGLKYDFYKHGTIVREIDTQKLTREVGAWVDGKNPNNEIGLERLCKEVFRFVHEDAHTALNDAARTVICAVNLALDNWERRVDTDTSKTMTEVAHDLEKHSQEAFVPRGGTALCCTRCGARDHSNEHAECKVAIQCAACQRFDETSLDQTNLDRRKHIDCHIEQYCQHIAAFNAWKRRVLDAHRKSNPPPPGPPAGSHPPSSWRGAWPLKTPGEVLRARAHEKQDLERNVLDGSCAGRNVLPLAETDLGVKVVAFQSAGRANKRARRDREQTKENSNETRMSRGFASRGDQWRSNDAWDGPVW